jgi:hypothetical protein
VKWPMMMRGGCQSSGRLAREGNDDGDGKVKWPMMMRSIGRSGALNPLTRDLVCCSPRDRTRSAIFRRRRMRPWAPTRSTSPRRGRRGQCAAVGRLNEWAAYKTSRFMCRGSGGWWCWRGAFTLATSCVDPKRLIQLESIQFISAQKPNGLGLVQYPGNHHEL